jgi:hypothetical protein
LHFEKHVNLAGQLVAFPGVAGFTGRNTILECGFSPLGFRYNVIDCESEFSRPAVCTLKSITNQYIFFAKGDACPINGSDQFDQPHHGRNFKDRAAGTFDGLGGISDNFHLPFGQQTERPSPIHNVQKSIIGI